MAPVTHRVHWWRFSTPERDVGKVLDAMAGGGGDFGPVEHRGGFNQPMRFIHDSGALVFFGSQREDQPIVVEAQGDACERLEASELARWAVDLSGRVSRSDFAADVLPADLATARLVEMRSVFRRGKCDTRIPATSCRWYEDDDPGGGRTLYVGRPSSELMVRAYDRRGPLRIELEYKPERAAREALPSALAKYGPGAVWRQLAMRCVWPMPWFRELLAGDVSAIDAGPVEGDDFQRFMMNVMDQLGASLFAAQLLGVTMADLAVRPERPNAQQVRRWATWADQAGAMGYDGGKLKAEVRRWRKRK